MRLGQEHISFETAKIGSLVDVQDSEDPEGLRVMYYLVQDLKVSDCEMDLAWYAGLQLTPLSLSSVPRSALCNHCSASTSESSQSGDTRVSTT